MIQQDAWADEFGDAYLERNCYTTQSMDTLWLEKFGVTRTELNKEFIPHNVGVNARILEVGCSTGTQLALLQERGFNNLYGIDVNYSAISYGQRTRMGLNLIMGSALDIPFKDNFFDLVFTSGLLIHIPPAVLPLTLSEIYRCTRNYIWGYEYFSDEPIAVNYRGRQEMLWKQDFYKAYKRKFSGLRVVKRKRLSEGEGLESEMFLLRKEEPGE